MREPKPLPGQPDWSKMKGLIPAVVQDERTGRVLMLAYMNRESLEATMASGLGVFWSRSRSRLWQKGETSGNVLHVSRLSLDCDHDSILMTVRPTGSTCHTGRESCFLEDATRGPFEFLPYLDATVRKRMASGRRESYVRRMVEKGEAELARKVGEEAIEVILAVREGPRQLISEGADLLFHLLLLLRSRGVGFDCILEELMERRLGGTAADMGRLPPDR